MEKNRLEAFSDGVVAIIITIMVLELKAPELKESGRHAELADLKPLLPVFLSYVLSFVYVGIYWNNHHHMLQSTRHVTGGILWANLHLLFWLSLFPFATAWVGQNHFDSTPTAMYGVILFLAAIAYTILQRCIIKNQGPHSILGSAVGRDLKGKLSVVLYCAAILFAFVHPWISNGIFVLVAAIWFIPDRRIERTLERLANDNHSEHKGH
jgi:Predicted integral membrane protein